ncbi:MAG: hypothetical protein PHR06_03680 [Candidatus Cloacimonetes bacterium]|nr:hypothetical protein [Candidatus Cloacimonadota bacterium]
MKRLFLITMLLTSLSVYLLADSIHKKAGEYGFQFIKLESSVNLVGLSDSGELISSNAMNFISNPTSGILYQTNGFSASSRYWIFDTVLYSIGYSFSSGTKSFSLAMKYLDYGSIDNRDEFGTIEGEYNPMDLDIVAGFGFRVLPDHLLGINTHVLYEKLHTSSSFGFSADLAYTYLTPIRNLKIGTQIKNIGFTSKMKDESIDLPWGIEFLAAQEMRFNDIITPSFQIKIAKYVDENISTAIATNITFYDTLHLRLGNRIIHGSDYLKFSAGLGYDLGRFQVDYAFLALEEDLDNSHTFGVSYKF